MQRDIYLAHYTVDRLESIPDDQPQLQLLMNFLNGAVNMLKKKFKEGLEILEKVDSKLFSVEKELQYLVPSYIAFGLFSLGRVDEARNVYNTIKIGTELAEGDTYNMCLCNGILLTEQKEFARAREEFEKARRMYRTRVEPTFYLTFLRIIEFLSENQEQYRKYITDPRNKIFAELHQKLRNLVKISINDLEAINQINDSNSNMHFYIGLLKTIRGDPKKAVESFLAAIEKSDDNYFDHYFWKGVALAVGGCYDMAINELETSRNIDKNKPRASLFIGNCHLLMGDLDSAYDAFKAVISDALDELEVNYCIGKFFMTKGFMRHAIQSFQFASKTIKVEKVLQELVKCYVSEKNLVNALDTYNNLLMIETSSNKKLYSYDKAVLDSMKLLTENSEDSINLALQLLQSLESVNPLEKREGFCFKKIELDMYRAVAYYLKGDFQQALKTLTLMELDYYSQSFSEKDSNQDQSKIPSVLPKDEKDAFEAVFIAFEDIGSDDKTFLPTKTITKPELIYNIAVCQLLLKNYDKAYLRLATIRSLSQIARNVEKLLKIIQPLVSESVLQKYKEKAAATLTSSNYQDILDLDDLENYDNDSNEIGNIRVFPATNRLCCIYPTHKIELPVPVPTESSLNSHSENELLKRYRQQQQEGSSPVHPGEMMTRVLNLPLSFCLPQIVMPDINLYVGFEELKNITIRSVEFRPEAPWIMKMQEKVVFTNNVVEDDVVVYPDAQAFIDKLTHHSSIPISTHVRLNILNAEKENINNLNKKNTNKVKETVERSSNSQDEAEEEEDLDAGLSPQHNIYDHEENSERRTSTEEKKVDLKKLRQQLELDDRTNEFLKKLMK